MITNEQIDTWLQDAKNAQGKWVYSANQGVYSVNAVGEEDISPCVYDWCNAVHITNLCPSNAIAILEELKMHRAKYRSMEEYTEIEAAE